MPRNAEVIRQWNILRAIEASRRATIDGLAESHGVTTRTIRRDLEALQAAGFPLFDEVEDGKRHWRIDTRPFKALADTGFTLSELCALYFSRTLLDVLAGTPFRDDLAAAFAKFERALSPKMRQFLDRLPNVLQAKAEPRRRPQAGREREAIARLIEGTLSRRRASMRYHSFSSGRTKEYLVEPYRLVYAGGGLYLIALVPEYKGLRTFAVERIEALSLLEETFEPNEALADEVFQHSLGMNQGTPERIEIEFTPPVARYVAERLWHPSQALDERPDGSIQLTLDVCDDWALRRWILGFGPFARVMAPPTLARAIVSDIERARARYGSVAGD
ncbi:MAG: helix-turn-helix transcriptional regulator [Vicinamibacterales bacterium]